MIGGLKMSSRGGKHFASFMFHFKQELFPSFDVADDFPCLADSVYELASYI